MSVKVQIGHLARAGITVQQEGIAQGIRHFGDDRCLGNLLGSFNQLNIRNWIDHEPVALRGEDGIAANRDADRFDNRELQSKLQTFKR